MSRKFYSNAFNAKSCSSRGTQSYLFPSVAQGCSNKRQSYLFPSVAQGCSNKRQSRVNTCTKSASKVPEFVFKDLRYIDFCLHGGKHWHIAETTEQ